MTNWKKYFTSEILERGRNYYKRNLVCNVRAVDDGFEAFVMGSRPYEVEVWNAGNGQLGMTCTCPHANSGYNCKHMAALCFSLEDLELEDGEFSDSDFKDAQGTSQIDPVVKPFVSKNTPNRKVYTCFDMAEMTSELTFYQSEVEKAKKLIEEEAIKLNHVRIGAHSYYGNGANMTGSAGFLYLERGAWLTFTMVFTTDDIVYSTCCASGCKNYYDARSYYRSGALCVHQLAGLFLLEEYIDKHNPGDTTDAKAHSLLYDYQMRYRSQVIDNVVEKTEDFIFEPKLENCGDFLQLSFRVGTDKLYVAKNLTELIEKIEQGDSHTFGKNNEIDFGIHKVSVKSKSIYEFVKKVVNEEVQRSRAERYYSRYYDDSEIKNVIPLYGRRLDEVYDLLSQEGGTVLYQEKYVGNKKQTLFLKEKQPKLVLNVAGDYDRNNVLKGVEVYGKLPETFRGEDYYYYIEGNAFCRIPKDVTEVLAPLFDAAFEGEVSFAIGRKSMPEFYNHMMPMLSEYIEFVGDDYVEENYLPTPPTFRFYLDAEDDIITCKAQAIYDEQAYSLLELIDQTPLPEEVRDLSAEHEAMYHMLRYFDATDETRGLFTCEYTEENVFSILENGINELLIMGEVYCTEKLKRVRVHTKTPVTVGVSLVSGIMDLEISSDAFSNEELLDILASYQKKKKYHRLKNGDFLNLNDDSLSMLSEMMETMQIPTKEFLKGNIKIPAYRALYLDKVLEKNKQIYTERDKHFKNLIKEFKTVSDSEFEVPASLQKTMRSYQVEGFKWLKTLERYGFGGILADDMGLGKTLQMISVILAAKEEGRTGTSLIISPASLVYNWQEEFARFAPSVRVAVVSGTQGVRAELLRDYAKYDVLITSYDLLKRDVAEYEDKQFLYQVLDEAQYIKNHSTAGAKAVKCIQSEVKYALTGTPIENRLSELWSIFDYLMPGFLYSYEKFRKEYEMAITKYKDEEKIGRLKKMVAPFILRRLKQDVLTDLPEKLEEVHYARLEEKQQTIYDGQVVHMMEVIQGQSNEDFAQNKIQILAELTKLRQICCDPSLLFENYHAESAKRIACMELIQSALEGEHRILLFSQFTSMLALLEADLKKAGIEYYKITGSTSKEERMRLVKAFNEGDVPIFLISLKAGGTGLNLVGADVVIHYDPWWNQAVQNQATDRAHRIGQMKVVTVYKLIAKGTIEEKIVQLQESKKNLADEILSGETGGLAQLSKDELLELLQ